MTGGATLGTPGRAKLLSNIAILGELPRLALTFLALPIAKDAPIFDVVARPMGAFLICDAARAARLVLGWPLISKGELLRRGRKLQKPLT